MTSAPSPSSWARQGSVAATALLTTIVPFVLPGAIAAAVAIFHDVRRLEPAMRTDISIFLLPIAALLPAAILSAPLLVLVARMTRLRHAVYLTLLAVSASCLLAFFFPLPQEAAAKFISRFLATERVSIVEDGDIAVSLPPEFTFAQLESWQLIKVASIAAIHCGLVLALCAIYRTVWGNCSRKSWTIPNHTSGRRQFVIILASIVCLLSVGFALERGNQAANVPRGAWEALRHPHEMILSSIDNNGFSTERKILGETPVSSPSDRQLVYSTLRHAVTSRIHWGGWPMCFNPRHQVRVTSGNRTYDFLICFECNQIGVLRDEQIVGGALIDGSRNPLDAILQEANVPLDFPAGQGR